MENTNMVYMIEGSSYDGCEGWSSWMIDEVFGNKEKAQDWINTHKNTYSRYKVIEKMLIK